MLGLEKYNLIQNRIRYLISLKSGITYVFSNSYANIKIDPDGDFYLEETLTLLSVVMIIKSVFNKNKNYYYYNLFLAKCPFQLVKLLQKRIAAKSFDSITMLRIGKTKVSKEEFYGAK